jgi:D-alanyl-D-alanine carboxypeptidase/D-alanyl-D-alanine-endopeptidase (penicillin-binding protein 4)
MLRPFALLSLLVWLAALAPALAPQTAPADPAAADTTSAPAGSADAARVAAAVDAVLDGGVGEEAFWGVYVADARTGEQLYARNAGLLMLPASNQKILTAALALDTRGADYTYETKLLASEQPTSGVLRGDLLIVGTGDPSLGSTVIAGDVNPFDDWAEALAARGVTRVEGRIIGWDNTFDDRAYAEGWDVDYVAEQSSRLLGVSASGLSFGDNLVIVRVRPGSRGSQPNVETRPGGFLDIDNRATTTGRRRGQALRVERQLGTDDIVIRGSVGSRGSTVEIPVFNPTLLAVQAFANELQEAGIAVGASLHDVDDLENAPDRGEMTELFVHESPPLTDLLDVVNKESNNFYAEQIFRSVAFGGSADGGEDRVETLIQRAGGNPQWVSVRDGSGLSRKNLITPRQMGQVLVFMNGHEQREAFRGTLARGGEPQSTLRYRMSGLPVLAKTGSLSFVRALSGYVDGPDGELVFVIFANNFGVPPYRITSTIDRIVTGLAQQPAS